VLAEFAHVVTNPRRFEHPLDMAAALEMCEQWWNAVECRPVAVDAEAGIQFLAWMREYRLGRKRLLDTLLAACYHRAGVTRIATSTGRVRALACRAGGGRLSGKARQVNGRSTYSNTVRLPIRLKA